jgi:hypothetical protein
MNPSFSSSTDAIVDNVVYPEGRAGFAHERLLDLNFHSFLCDQRHALKKFRVSLIAGFEIGFVVLARILGKGFFTFLLLGFEKMCRIN